MNQEITGAPRNVTHIVRSAILSKVSGTQDKSGLRNRIFGPSSPSFARAIAVFFFLLTLATNILLVWLYGLNHGYDAYGYMWLGQEYFDFSKPPFWFFRTLPYVLLNGMLGSISNPYPLVAIQILASAAAVAAMSHFLAKINLFAAVLTGFLLATDLAWASSNRIAQTEISASMILLAVVIFASHAKKRFNSLWILSTAGFIFGIAFSIRANHVPILLLIPIAYLLLYRSFKAAGSVASGIILCLTLQCSFNAMRTGHFALSETNSVFLVTPLAVNGLIQAENGAASESLLSAWNDLYPGERMRVDIWAAQLKLDNFRIFLKNEKRLSDEQIGNLYRKAYTETILGSPKQFVIANALQLFRALSVRTSYLFDYNSDPWWRQIRASQICELPWCGQVFWNRVPIDTAITRFYHHANVVMAQP